MPASLPEITLEISSGTLTIRTAEAVYHVMVAGGGAPAPSQPPPAPAALAAAPALSPPPPSPHPSPPAEGAPDDEDYYRELSNDMYLEVGRLARRLSMSIRDVSIDKIESMDFGAAGSQLENAKDELENVVKMTEQATLKIMDFTEAIQSAVDTSQDLMKRIMAGGRESRDPDPAREEEPETLEALNQYLSRMRENPLAAPLAKAGELRDALRQAASSPPPPPPAASPASPQYEFPLELVFQTMYELCTNEAVKKHIKTMWDSAGQAFDGVKLESGLNAAAESGGGPDEDNFLNLDLKEVLKAMFQATGKDNFQQVLKKMASTADQIFLEQTLPLEAIPKAAGGPPPPPPPPP
ncbi:MAG: protein phosphatase CheZ, partial [Desulfarculales bacterium]|nr:protein phosphatase CheZ [Desulfarculales bacterium]